VPCVRSAIAVTELEHVYAHCPPTGLSSYGAEQNNGKEGRTDSSRIRIITVPYSSLLRVLIQCFPFGNSSFSNSCSIYQRFLCSLFAIQVKIVLSWFRLIPQYCL
jgi:hypothetical protein